MPNYKKHADTGAIVGGVTGIVINLIYQSRRTNQNNKQKIDFSELFLCGVGGSVIGTIGGILPDKLEPARNPHHRKFFHSIFTSTVIGYGLYKTNSNNNMCELTKGIITTAGIGYLSHLALDSQTPKRLPLL